MKKYKAVKEAPISVKGDSTGFAPIQVRSSTVLINTQNLAFLIGENFLFNLFSFKHKVSKTKIDNTIATTPPNFDGIDRKIAYANKKYHSGWICGGVVVILALLKFSTSPNMLGDMHTNLNIKNPIIIRGIESFTKKYGKNFILS